jgi:hypothetical protein
MPEIRPFGRDDLDEVVALLQRHMRRWTLDAQLLAGLTLDDPWADAELPSLVALGPKDEIIGFTGVQVRRMRFDGRPIRGVHSGHGVVNPDRRGGATGALLIGRALSGPQDLTWSDGASDPVAGVFRTFGGQLDHARSCDWMLVLRPVRWLSGITRAATQRSTREQAALRSLVPVGALPFQAVGPRLMRRALPGSAVDMEGKIQAGVTGEDASAAMIVERLPGLNKDLRLWVDYDEEYLEHLFGLVRYFNGLDSFKGPLFCRLVRRGDRPIGWYAYVARPGGASRVLQLHALKREPDAVLGELISHARAQGSAALAGRAEPHLHRALRQRLAVLGYARQPMVVAKDPELAAAMATSSSLVTRLDGDLFSV